MRRLILALALAATAAPALAQPALKPPLAGMAFMLGDWTGDQGKVTVVANGSSSGVSHVTLEAGGAVMLRRDHTDIFGPGELPLGGFDQIMMIYPDAGGVHADYSDGEHVLHYTSATIVPGHSVVFTTTPQAGAPTFRLTYELTPSGVIAVDFAGAPPGDGPFKDISSGILRKRAPKP